MITHQKESTTKKNFQTILISTLLVAVLDILAASVVFNLWFKMTPIQVFQFIASSVYGQLPAAIITAKHYKKYHE
ncbi:hypothetical protein [uncultured Chryseobacterium sp.]|uniref:hypothetical protein n=1 Tax=uncultured Chryseobacterium sp. TaxID=259322 RepID=UPI00258FBCDF|nr:hypothetical protein [uncultured Chryseobacterium sp.]